MLALSTPETVNGRSFWKKYKIFNIIIVIKLNSIYLDRHRLWVVPYLVKEI